LERSFQEPVELAERYASEHPDNIEAQRLYLQMLVAWVPSGAQAGELAEATPLARKLLIRDPKDPYFLYVNGMLERQAGDYKAAKEHLEKSIAVDPADDRPHYELGLVLAALKDPARAEREFRKTLALGNNRPEVRFQLAKVLRTLDRTDEANQQMKIFSDQTAAASQQRIAKLKEAQADQALAAGRNDEAVRLLREATQATPDSSWLQFKLALALDKTGDISGEQIELQKTLQIDPNMAMAQNQLGYLASRSGDVISAEEHFRRAVQAVPTYTEAWINLAATLGMESKLYEAQQAVAEALKVDPNNATALQLQQELKSAQH
jgi:Flp pilus assembly protein TadD